MPTTRDTGYISAYPVVVGYTEAAYGTATGGSSSSITVGGVNYTLLSFTSDDNLVVSKAGLFDVLLVGGGGGGYGSSSGFNYGGGGAGGLITSTVYLSAATFAVDVGAGGAAGLKGLDSAIGSTTAGSTVCPTAAGGGGTRIVYDLGNTSVGVGGSGGGNQQELGALTNGILGQGNNGGAGAGPNFSTAGGGGGGGAAAVGGNGGFTPSGVGGDGGAGLDISAFLGQALTTTYKAGGGGGRCSGGTSGAGGIGGGGAGNSAGSGSGTAGTANSGGGGGAGFTGGAGGSGIVYVRFKV